MLDIYKYGGPSKIDIDVKENRAPTDDSIRIYDEMREKAINSVIASGKDKNRVDTSWVVFRNPWSQSHMLNITCFVNGDEISIPINIDDITFHYAKGINYDEIIKLVHEKVVEAIASEISLKTLYQSLEQMYPYK